MNTPKLPATSTTGLPPFNRIFDEYMAWEDTATDLKRD